MSDEIFNITMAIQLCTFQLHPCCCAAPCHSEAFTTQRCFSPPTSPTTSCTFPGHMLTPHHHHYLLHNLSPHGRCRSRQLHPPFPHHNHRHFLIHNHNHIKLHLLCLFQLLLHCPTALPHLGRLCNHPSRHRSPHTQPQCFHPQHLPLLTCCPTTSHTTCRTYPHHADPPTSSTTTSNSCSSSIRQSLTLSCSHSAWFLESSLNSSLLLGFRCYGPAVGQAIKEPLIFN